MTITYRDTKGEDLDPAEVDANFRHVLDSANGTFVQSGTGSISRPSQNKMREWLSPEDKGALGDGVTDDSAAFTAAAADGRTIKLTPGLTYVTGPFSLATAGQGVIGWGSTVKLKGGSSNALVKLNATGCFIEGGTWDANSVAHQAIVPQADYCRVQFATLQNCGDAGIYATANANYLTLANNTIKDAVTYGIYVEGTTADTTGNQILNNVVDTSAQAGASGIYLTGSNDPYTYKQKKWLVRGNKVNGSTSSPTGSGITCRGIEGVCTENVVTGYTLGISCDITTDSVVASNRVSGVAGATAYSYEINGSNNVISGNYSTGGVRGIVSSVNGTTQPNQPSMDYTNYHGNVIVDPSGYGIYIAAVNGGKTANYCRVGGNLIVFTTVGTSRIGVGLVNSGVRHALVEGNQIVGPGSGQAGGRGVQLDTTGGYANVINNKISGFERAASITAGGATAFVEVHFNFNDVSQDDLNNPIVAEGSATFSTNCSMAMNNRSDGLMRHIFDLANNIQVLLNQTGSPSGSLTAGKTSLYIRTDGSSATTRAYINTDGSTTWTSITTAG